jgi:hypothetical protein
MTGVVMEAAKHLLTLCSEIGDLASDVRHSSSSCAMFVPCCSLEKPGFDGEAGSARGRKFCGE